MLYNAQGQPLNTAHHVPNISRDAGSFRGTIHNYHPTRVPTADGASIERQVAQTRAADLFANDWAAQSGVRTVADNAIGTGLVPKATIAHSHLGISRDEAAVVGEKLEWIFSLWSSKAHSGMLMHFEDLQYLGVSSMLRMGEMLHLPVMIKDEKSRFTLRIQDIKPTRLCTPSDKKTDLSLRDGIEFTSYGAPIAYWIATPDPSYGVADVQHLFSTSYTRRLAHVGHRPNVFHLYRHDEEEQVRGHSALATGMKLFRNLNDAIDSELFAQIIASSFPVFIGLEGGGTQLPLEVAESFGHANSGPHDRFMDIAPGTITFGEQGEKPQVLENNRPSSNFPPFVEIILRALAASIGIPYESLTKDYSKTNYSSMRAALNEAWKLYLFYRRWFARMYCQPIWAMVIEEAYLRNIMGIADDINALSPKGFYANQELWCAASWIGPARGFIDPVKEIQATTMALDARLMTYAEAWAERGGDFGDALPVMEYELASLQKLPSLQGKTTPKQQTEETEQKQEQDDEH